MPGFGSACSALLFAKGSRRDDKAARDADRARIDREEHAKVRARSKGRCEVRLDGVRCKQYARHDHHRYGGIGRRNLTAESISHKNRLHMCQVHHTDEHDNRLRALGWNERNWAASVTWERV